MTDFYLILSGLCGEIAARMPYPLGVPILAFAIWQYRKARQRAAVLEIENHRLMAELENTTIHLELVCRKPPGCKCHEPA